MYQTFTIPGRLDGLNDYIRAAHSPHFRAQLKRENEARVKEAAARMVPMAPPVTVAITYYEAKAHGTRQQVRDLDNVLGGGNKFILDALVSMGILEGDDAARLPRFTAKGYLATNGPRIVVEMEN